MTTPVGDSIPPDKPDDLTVIRQVYAALAAGDQQAILALTSPDVIIDQSDKLPYGGHFQGYPGLAAFNSGVFGALDSSVEIGELFQAGDRVIQVGRTKGTARRTGRAFDSPEVHVWGVRDGQVVSLHAFVDEQIVNAALAD